jgi:hypothetical protein
MRVWHTLLVPRCLTSKLTISTYNYSTSLLFLLRAVTYRYRPDQTTEENARQESKLTETTRNDSLSKQHTKNLKNVGEQGPNVRH